MSQPGTSNEQDRLVVVDRPERDRYELQLDDEIVGFATYSLRDDVITVPHVETAPAHRGKDFAACLMGVVVAEARARSLTIRPLCGYANTYMRRRPDTHDLWA